MSVAWDYSCASNNQLLNFKIRTNATANQSQILPTYQPGVRAATFNNLDPGMGHYFYISACNQFCSNESPMLWGVTLSPTAPGGPTNLHWCGEVQFELCQTGGPTLLWSDNANNESEYRVYYTSAPPVPSRCPRRPRTAAWYTAGQPQQLPAEPPEWLELQLHRVRLELSRRLDRVESENHHRAVTA